MKDKTSMINDEIENGLEEEADEKDLELDI